MATAPKQPLSVNKQRNLWGQTVDPHRVDLWYVDFDQAVYGIRGEYNLSAQALPNLMPQHAQSVTLPEPVKIRAEATRRESVAYQMPSWDEPLEPITVTFLLDGSTPNPVISLLEHWAGLVRAGRGLRSNSGGFLDNSLDASFATPAFDLYLNSDYKINFRFPVNIFLLQGSSGTTPLTGQTTTAQSAIAAVQSNIIRNSILRTANALKIGSTAFGQIVQAVEKEGVKRLNADYCVLTAAKTWYAKVWLSSYKVNELNYNTQNGLVTVTAVFQTEFLKLESNP